MRQRDPTSTTTDGERGGASGPLPSSFCGLTVVLTCRDDAEGLPDAVRDATAAAARCAAEHEIVIVDDGSVDESVAVAGAVAARDRRVRLVVHAAGLGYGETVRSGIAAARMPWVLLTDARLRLDPRDLDDLPAVAASADLVVGWRILASGPVGIRAEAALWNRVVRAALNLPVRDADCALRLARRELLARLDLRASGALVGAELVLKARVAGARTAELPIHLTTDVGGARAGRRISARTLRELRELRRAVPVGADR